jgi:hypothetical protein
VVGGLNQVVDELRNLAQRIGHSIREELRLIQNPQFSEPERTGKEG